MTSNLRHLPLLAVAASAPFCLTAPLAALLACLEQPVHASLDPSVPPQETPAALRTSLSPPPWQLAPADAGMSAWQSVPNEAVLAPVFTPVPALRNPADLAAQPRTPRPTERPDVLYDNVGIYGFGGGLQGGGASGDAWAGVLTGRLGYKLNENIAISLRPSYIFGNKDQQGVSNNEGAFQMPLTLDLFRRSFLSPYIGAGIAWNTDSTGDTDPMVTGGLDINLTRNLTLGLNVNYIFQNQVNDTDWAALSLIYFRF